MRAWNDKPPALTGVGLLRPLFRKALKLGLKPGPTQSLLLKGFAELKPEHGRIKSRVQLSFVVVANRDSVGVTGAGLEDGVRLAGWPLSCQALTSGVSPAQGSPPAVAENSHSCTSSARRGDRSLGEGLRC